MHIFAIAGSLRKQSYNRGLIRAAEKVAPEGVTIEVFDLEGIPVFNQDFESTPPPRVAELKSRIRAADAILIATPEYNYSVPGVLKNAIDWASRPYGDNAWDDKPLAIMGASPGAFGTARAQHHLRQMCVFLNMYPLNRPEILVTNAATRFDKESNLTDEKSIDLIRKLLEGLVAWTRRLVS